MTLEAVAEVEESQISFQLRVCKDGKSTPSQSKHTPEEKKQRLQNKTGGKKAHTVNTHI